MEEDYFGAGISNFSAYISFFLGIFSLSIIACVIYVFLIAGGAENKIKNDRKESKTQPQKNSKKSKKKDKGSEDKKKEVLDQVHPWEICRFKGHLDDVTSFSLSPNGKYMASCSEDQSILVWTMANLMSKDRRNVKVNFTFDTASLVTWSPDCKFILFPKKEAGSIEVCKVIKKDDGSLGKITEAISFKNEDQSPVVAISVANNGKFVMSIHRTGIAVFRAPKGAVIKTVNLCMNHVVDATTTADDNYVVVLDLNDGIKLWKIVYGSDGEMENLVVTKMFEKYAKSIHSFDVSSDGGSVVVLSGNYKWEKLLTSEKKAVVDRQAVFEYETEHHGGIIRISPDSKLIAVAIGNSVLFFSSTSQCLLKTLEAVQPCNITNIHFTFDGVYWIVCGDRILRLFNNLCGWQESLRCLLETLEDKSLSQALKSRIKGEVNDLKARIHTHTTVTCNKVNPKSDGYDATSLSSKKKT